MNEEINGSVTRGYSENSECFFAGVGPTTEIHRRLMGDGGSGILGKNPSAPLQESNLRPSDH